MFKFFGEVWDDLCEAIRWLYSPHAWRIVGVVVVNLGLVVALGYLSIAGYGVDRDPFSRCPGNRNLLFVLEFFSFCFFALFALITLGETFNWVDEKKKGLKPGINALLGYASVTAVFGIIALILIAKCA